MQKFAILNRIEPITQGTIRATCVFAFVTILCGCVKSPDPSVGELILIRPPTFTLSAGINTTVTTPSHSITLTGTCDSAGYGLFYAIDQTSSWTPVPGNCVNDAFTLTVPIHRLSTVYARSKTKLSYTAIAQIRVHYIVAPSSTTLSLAQAATSNDDSLRNMQAVVGLSYSGEQKTNGSVVLDTYMPGITYGP